ncbi:ankyrin repeat domain-containing protein SOWAHA [Dunckerocampus dactyliophorus]|uniref:ankyrin repeat domain-containing protein SOWAHA n=1 Tax=Dunckerocampus dactyliophorus TaxID=161453 RepID=UPI002405932C|nr:ankyrin repeat domain-containing protein SOWAHA [Dunckerocampus dactyliophorus]
MALTQESVLSFLLERGGKVRNAELLNHFGGLIHSGAPAAKQHNRELFKKLVNSVAVVRQIDGVKFVAVKKRYQDFVVQDELSQNSTSTRLDAAQILYSDLENNNNNVCYPSHMNLHGTLQRSTSNTTVQVLNICGDQVGRASGAVFAVIAVTSPPKVSTPPEKVTARSCLDAQLPVCNKNEAPQRWANMEADDVQPPSLLQGSQNKSQRLVEEAECCGSVPLEPLAHEWLVKCAAGLWGHVHAMLLQDGRLAQKKDFMSGFTALHWAAKDGNTDMIHKLMDISRRRGTHVNINSKAHGGYTPLHIAAIHGHTEVMLLLVQRYGASVNERDNDGKKAHHYLGEAASEKVRALVGGMQLSKYWDKTDDEDYKEQAKGLNTISKLFQPHRKQKHATRLTHD